MDGGKKITSYIDGVELYMSKYFKFHYTYYSMMMMMISRSRRNSIVWRFRTDSLSQPSSSLNLSNVQSFQSGYRPAGSSKTGIALQ